MKRKNFWHICWLGRSSGRIATLIALPLAATNVLAVEIDQAAPNSSDISFALELSVPPPPPPCRAGIALERLGNGRVRVSRPLPECGYVIYHTSTFRDWAPLPPLYETNATHLPVIRSEPTEGFMLRQR